jgi:hypothetical protein
MNEINKNEPEVSKEENFTKPKNTEKISEQVERLKTKNPKRVSAGRKGAEAKKIKSELKKKEMETIRKENVELKNKSITKDTDRHEAGYNHNDDKSNEIPQKINIYKNYIPLCLVGVVGLGLYFYQKPKQAVPIKQQPMIQKKENDIFELN